jgi:hypothetical protein
VTKSAISSRFATQYATWSSFVGFTRSTVPGRALVMRYFRRSTARWSCALFMCERPSMPIRLASL